MSLVMTDLGFVLGMTNPMAPGIAVGVAGIAVALLTCPVFKQIFPDNKTFDLSEQLRECLLQFEDAWEEKELTMHLNLQEQLMLTSDPELLSLVWNNLLSNAIKFTPQGGSIFCFAGSGW